jgi:hypothetical protein
MRLWRGECKQEIAAVESNRRRIGGGRLSMVTLNRKSGARRHAEPVDEVVIHVVPILLGEGIRLFDVPGTKPIMLERRRVVASAQVTSMRLAVVREA